MENNRIECELYNMYGQVVLKKMKEVYNSEFQLELKGDSYLLKGFYLLNIKNANFNYVRKLIVE